MRRSSDHPNILKLYEVYETHKHIFLVLELITGNFLKKFLIKLINAITY